MLRPWVGSSGVRCEKVALKYFSFRTVRLMSSVPSPLFVILKIIKEIK